MLRKQGVARGLGLRHELIREACALVEERGTENLLRSTARRAGVSQTAPYLYFPAGSNELLAAVAIEGFTRLIDFMRDDRERGGRNIGEGATVAVRYVRFGVEHPQLYRAMFSRELRDRIEEPREGLPNEQKGYDTYLALLQVKADAFDVIRGALQKMANRGLLRDGNLTDFAKAVASMAHGLVGELIDEGLGNRSEKDPWAGRPMTLKMVGILFSGLLRKDT